MEQYKLQIKKRIALESLLAAVIAAVCIASFLGVLPTNPGTRFGDFMMGFLLGLSCTVVVFFIIGTVKKVRMLHNEEKLRNAFIKENDERTKFIATKTGGTVMYTCVVIILVAAIVAGFFNAAVFFTLLSCSMFLMLVIVALSAYYGRKY